MCSSASDVARAVALAAVVGDGGKADDHGDLFGGERAEFDEADDEGDSGCDPDAGDRGEDCEAAGKERIGGDQAVDFGLEIGDGGFEGAELTLELEDRPGRVVARADLVEEGGSGVEGGVAAAQSILEGFPGFRWRRRSSHRARRLSPRMASTRAVDRHRFWPERADGVGELAANAGRIDDGDGGTRWRGEYDGPAR